jgi:hypothetical protein
VRLPRITRGDLYRSPRVLCGGCGASLRKRPGVEPTIFRIPHTFTEGFYAQTKHSRLEASLCPPPLRRSGRFPGPPWPGARVADPAGGTALEPQLHSGRCRPGGEPLRRRWRGKPGGVYYPAFDPAACVTAFGEGGGAGSSSQVGSDTAQPAGTGGAGCARVGGHRSGGRSVRANHRGGHRHRWRCWSGRR